LLPQCVIVGALTALLLQAGCIGAGGSQYALSPVGTERALRRLELPKRQPIIYFPYYLSLPVAMAIFASVPLANFKHEVGASSITVTH
jgi:hypothetical protein